MRLGINFRSDLAKLGDSEIAETLERLLDERQALYASISPIVVDHKWLYQSGLWYWFGRGPFHSRVVYKILSGYFWPFKNNPSGTLYRYDCEIKDVRDEIAERIKQRKAAVETAR